MSTHSDPQSGAAPGSSTGQAAGDGQGAADGAASGFDAAEAAGFGGITWADEVEDEPLPRPQQSAAPPEGDGSVHRARVAEDTGESIEDGQGPVTGPGVDSGPGLDPAVGDDSRSPDDGLGDEGVPVEESTGRGAPAEDISVEDLVQDLERVAGERDQYLDASRRLQAEFENYRKAVAKRELEARERANETLIAELLPVLDACDGALASGASDVEPVRTSLIDALTKQGLERIDDQEASFDPERHEAVMHEPDEDGGGPVVAEVLRAGYSWKGRVIRPAMVRVRG